MRLVAKDKGDPNEVMQLEKFNLLNEHGLGKNEVLLELLAAPMNHADFFRVRGTYGKSSPVYPLVGGHEGTFRVIKTGEDVKSVKPGDVALTNNYGIGTWSSHLTLNEKYVQKLPDDIDVISSSMIRVNLSTVYRMLNDFVKLNEGDIIVQNGADGHVGQSFIQIAKSMGLKSINIVRKNNSTKSVDALKSIGADAILPISESDKLDFSALKDILKTYSWYNPDKVLIGFNGIGGIYFQAVEGLVSDGSHIITYGGMNKPSIQPTIASLIFRDIKYQGFSIGVWLPGNNFGDPFKEMNSSIVKLIQSGKYHRPPFECFPLLEYKSAIHKFFSRDETSILPKRRFFTWKTSFLQPSVTLCKRLLK